LSRAISTYQVISSPRLAPQGRIFLSQQLWRCRQRTHDRSSGKQYALVATTTWLPCVYSHEGVRLRTGRNEKANVSLSLLRSAQQNTDEINGHLVQMAISSATAPRDQSAAMGRSQKSFGKERLTWWGGTTFSC
jgi:hypothetical protein